MLLQLDGTVAEVTAGEVVAVDGKTARGSRDRRRGKQALHMVSAWGCRNRLVLGQEATEETSNEITAIPKLLELLELKGCIVTIDAMGCQTKIAAQIVDQGGDYVLGLKGNQSTLHEEVEEFFTIATAGDFAGVVHDHTEETDKDHGRLDVRRYWITEELGTLSDTARWPGLRSIGLVERECWIADRHTLERRVFVNSIPADAKRLRARGARPLGDREPLALAPGCRLRRRRQPYPQRQRAGDPDLDPPSVHESVRTRALHAALGAEAPQGRLG
jgi:predicted transposase YbfD/YdcC